MNCCFASQPPPAGYRPIAMSYDDALSLVLTLPAADQRRLVDAVRDHLTTAPPAAGKIGGGRVGLRLS